MKITRSQLRQLIKEEISAVIETIQVGNNDDPTTLDADDLHALAAELGSTEEFEVGDRVAAKTANKSRFGVDRNDVGTIASITGDAYGDMWVIEMDKLYQGKPNEIADDVAGFKNRWVKLYPGDDEYKKL